MSESYPTYTVFLGARSVTALFGIVGIISGSWQAEQTFDELGHKAFQKVKLAAPDDAADDAAEESPYFDEATENMQEELDGACPFPWLTFLGYTLLAISFLFPSDHAVADQLNLQRDFAMATICQMISVFLICVTIVWPMRQAYCFREVKILMKIFECAVVALLALCITIMLENSQGPIWLCPLGVIFIVMSTITMWSARKMGASWMRRGRPNPNPVASTLGGPLLVLGWVFLWISAEAHPGYEYFAVSPAIEIYVNERSMIAFTSAMVIVCLTHLVDQAHDQAGDVTLGLTEARVGCGHYTEIVVSGLFLLSWTAFGASTFLGEPATATHKIANPCLLLICLMQGRAMGLLLQKVVPSRERDRFLRLVRILVCGFFFIVVYLSLNGLLTFCLGLFGSAMIVSGYKMLSRDRKLGMDLVETEGPNENPIVYSTGSIQYTVGWILLSYAFSLP